MNTIKKIISMVVVTAFIIPVVSFAFHTPTVFVYEPITTQTSATLIGFIDPDGEETTVWFEWKNNSGLVSTRPQKYLNYTTYTDSISGLNENTTYEYYAVAQNSSGIVYSNPQLFRTLKNPSATPPTSTGSIPTVTTNGATNISQTSATLNGNLTATGGLCTTVWFEWGSNSGTVPTKKGDCLSTATIYNNTISGLSPNTTYSYFAVAKNDTDTVYGTPVTFKTESVAINLPPVNPPPGQNSSTPVPTTYPATNVYQNSAIVNGQVVSQGINVNTWFEYGTTQSFSYTTTPFYYGTGTTSYSAPLYNLTPNTTYYFRTVVQNTYGTVPGQTLSFVTPAYASVYNPPVYTPPAYSPPLVTTYSADVSNQFATLSGYVNPQGTQDTVRWFEWGRTTSFGTSTQQISHGSTASNFNSLITGLEPCTDYYYRAAARNSTGPTVYGSSTLFRTTCSTTTQSGQAPTVTTSFASDRTGRSAKLNGFIFTSVSQSSNAWFEWGTNLSLVNRTESFNRGSLPVTRHSDTISGLVLGQVYYYRIVAENSFGKTLGQVNSFVSEPVAIVETKTIFVNQVRPQPVLETIPVSSVPVIVQNNVAQPSLIALSIDGGSSVITNGSNRSYRIVWKNESTQQLKDVVLRVNFPPMINVESATRGVFSAENNTVTIDVKTLSPSESGETTISTIVDKRLKTAGIVVVTANMVYTNIANIQSDVIAYVTHTIESASTVLGANVFGSGSFVPTTLLEWIILFILVLILVLLGNNLYGRLATHQVKN